MDLLIRLFDTDVASTLQYITFPLEVIGLTLALIEVRYSVLTERINTRLKSMIARWRDDKEVFKYEHPLLYKFYGGSSNANTPAPTSSYLLLTALVLIIITSGIGIKVFDVMYLSVDGVVLYPALFNYLQILYFGSLVILLLVGVVLVGLFIAVIYVEDKAVGTLGLFIAGCGVLGEAYQMTAQLLI